MSSDPLRSAVPSQEPKHNPHYVVGLEKSIEDAEEAGHALGYERCVWYLADIIKDLGQKLALASASASVPEIGVELSCLLCGLVKPWGSWERGVAVCRDCRDAAWLYRRGFAPASASPHDSRRLIELAGDAASAKHHRWCSWSGWGVAEGHTVPQRDCQHSDCVLVRSSVSPQAKGEASERAAFDAGLSYGVHYSGWTADQAWTDYRAKARPASLDQEMPAK